MTGYKFCPSNGVAVDYCKCFQRLLHLIEQFTDFYTNFTKNAISQEPVNLSKQDQFCHNQGVVVDYCKCLWRLLHLIKQFIDLYANFTKNAISQEPINVWTWDQFYMIRGPF